MATANVAKQLSCSFVWGTTASPTNDQIFMEFNAQGQNMFVASGDGGAYSPSFPAYFPSIDPYITSVGGTSLTTDSAGGPWQSETSWSAGIFGSSSGGFSTVYAIPSYEQGIATAANQGSATLRNIPDVSAAASNIYLEYNGTVGVVGGTSAAAPLWAGFLALANQQAVANGHLIGFLNPTIYALTRAENYQGYFHDITIGNNFNSGSPNMFSAVPGYDLVTGLGTPVGPSLIDGLASDPFYVLVMPVDATVPRGGTQQFAVKVLGSSTQTVTWSIIPPAAGTITGEGLYSAPATRDPNSQWDTVQACSAVAPNPCRSAVANLLPTPIYALTVTLNTEGTVTSSDGNINCPTTCSEQVLAGTTLQLAVLPNIGYGFDHWTGACNGLTCLLTVNSNTTVGTTFQLVSNWWEAVQYLLQ
jgi:hypothetical protein